MAIAHSLITYKVMLDYSEQMIANHPLMAAAAAAIMSEKEYMIDVRIIENATGCFADFHVSPGTSTSDVLLQIERIRDDYPKNPWSDPPTIRGGEA